MCGRATSRCTSTPVPAAGGISVSLPKLSPAHVAIKVSRVCHVAQSREHNDPLSQGQRNSNYDVSFGHITGLKTTLNKRKNTSLPKRPLANGVSVKCSLWGRGGGGNVVFAPSLERELHE